MQAEFNFFIFLLGSFMSYGGLVWFITNHEFIFISHKPGDSKVHQYENNKDFENWNADIPNKLYCYKSTACKKNKA